MIVKEIRHYPDGTSRVVEIEVDDSDAARQKAAFLARRAARNPLTKKRADIVSVPPQ